VVLQKKKGLRGQHVVIIGNGIAGNTALSAIRSFDREIKVTLISAEEYPLYSPCAFYKYIAGELEHKKLFLKRLDDYSREKVGVIFGQRISEIDPKTRQIFVKDTAIHFDHLVLATGSKAFFPLIEGVQKRGVFALKTMSDAQSIVNYPGKRVVIVGSGPIGIETAVALRKKGLEIIVVEICKRILPRFFDDKSSLMCRNVLEENGIRIQTDEGVLEILGNERVTGVATDKHEIPCDMVIMGAGVQPDTELARTIGLNIGGLGGIRVDDYMLTNVDGIYACGDCIESKDIITQENTLSLLWANAKRQGWVAGCNCVGERRKFRGSFDATIIEMFGLYAISGGRTSTCLENREDFEIIEGTGSEGYYRLIVLNNTLVGIQLIDRNEYAGFLFSKMLRKDGIRELAKLAFDAKLLSIKPWSFWISEYITPGRGLSTYER
jgi:NADPH-dependent 2,4-dienoyl-CoA reductase/sulfur reductase-like enzyme